MDFRTAARRLGELTDDMSHVAGELSTDMSMDPTMQDAHDPAQTQMFGQPPVSVDGQDPATPGGAAPYNGAPPFSEPVTSDQEWLDPQDRSNHQRAPVPHTPGPDEDKTTLHNARLGSYVDKAARYGSR